MQEKLPHDLNQTEGGGHCGSSTAPSRCCCSKNGRFLKGYRNLPASGGGRAVFACSQSGCRLLQSRFALTTKVARGSAAAEAGPPVDPHSVSHCLQP